MNVISCTVDDQGCSPNFTDDASEVGKQIRPKIWLDQGTPSLGAENKMQQNVTRCMRQASFAPAGASPFILAYPRLAPWAALLRRFAASSSSRLNGSLICDNRHINNSGCFRWVGPLEELSKRFRENSPMPQRQRWTSLLPKPPRWLVTLAPFSPSR
jgi:hypothetical protein